MLCQLHLPCDCRMKKCSMKTKNAVGMVWQIQLPCVMHYICHVTATTIAMLNQLQLPRGCPNVKCSTVAKKMYVTWCIKFSCHVSTCQLPSQVRTTQKNMIGTKVKLQRCMQENYKDMTSVPCTIGSANLTASCPRPLVAPSLRACLLGKQRQLA